MNNILSNQQYLHNTYTQDEYNETKEVFVNINTRDRNVSTMKNPFNLKISFNNPQNKTDKFGNTGLNIPYKFNDIKYFEIVNVVTPRNLWRNGLLETTDFKYTKLNCPCNLNGDGKLQLNSKDLILSEDDIVSINSENLTVQNCYVDASNTYIQTQEFTTVASGSTEALTLVKVKLGNVYYTAGTTTIDSLTADFSYLSSSDTITINSVTYTVDTVVNPSQITVTSEISETSAEMALYLANKDPSFNIDTLYDQYKFSFLPENMSEQWDGTKFVFNNISSNTSTNLTPTAGDIIVIGTEYFVYDGVDSTTGFLKSLNKINTPVYNQLFKLTNKETQVLKESSKITYNTSTDTLTTNYVIFDNLSTNTIVKLSNSGNASNLIYGTISSINNSNSITLTEFYNSGTFTPDQLSFYSATYLQNIDMATNKYLSVNIAELSRDTQLLGTNDTLAKAFGTLYPYSIKDSFVYFSGQSQRLYKRRDLKDLSHLTLRIHDETDTLLNSQNLLETDDRTNTRHILNDKNQVYITLKIVYIDRNMK